MQEKELLNKLQELGFKEYESRVFLVLIKGSCLSATDIAKKAKIHRTAVYDILKKFAQKGYCNEIETNTILKYEIIDPRVVFDRIQQEFQNANKVRLTKLKDTFEEVFPLSNTDKEPGDNAVNIELIRGFNKHRHIKFLELFKQAKKEILFMIRLEGQISEDIDNQAVKFFENGGIIKSIYEASLNFKIVKDKDNFSTDVIKIDDLINLCQIFEKSGEKVKISTREIPNITIFDREIVFINIEDKRIPRHNKSDIIIRNEEFASRMIDLFNYYWEQSFTTKELKEMYKNKDNKNVSIKS